MSKMFTGSIDLNKIDKSKIVTTDKNGNLFQNGAKYLNVVIWVNDEPDQYGNHMSIQVSQSKEERDAKQKATYIANLKKFIIEGQSQGASLEPEEDDLPF